MSVVNRRIAKVWHDYSAKYLYVMEEFKPYRQDHSCYGCYDSMSWQRRRCGNNRDHWQSISQGDEDWAQRTARHYGLTVPE